MKVNGNHFGKEVKMEKNKKLAMEEYYLDKVNYNQLQDDRRRKLLDRYKDFYFIKGLKDTQDDITKITDPATLAQFTSYINKEKLEKLKEVFEKRRKPAEIDPFFKKKIANSLKSDDIKISTIGKIKEHAIMREYIQQVDGIEFDKLKKYLLIKKRTGHEIHLDGDSEKFLINNIMEFHDEVNETKVHNMKNVILAQKKKRELYKLYFKG